MKIEELKHNHSLTDLLKILLFTILMLAPIAMVATRCLYVVCNKNAYESYSNKIEIVNEYETNDVETLNDLVLGRAYTFTYDENITGTYRLGIEKILLNDNITNYNFNTIGIGYDTTIRTNYNFNGTTYNVISISPYNDTYNQYTTITSIDFIYGNANYNQNADYLLPCISRCNNLPIQSINNEDGTLDNVFEYSISQLEESTLFNWTENTAIYSGINAMNTQLGINSPAITIVLTYWLILTCIYVIIDIVLKLFTYITHMISSRKS